MIKINLRRIVVFAVLLAAVLMLSRRSNFFEGLSEPPFTTFSTGYEGAALLYDSLKIMGFPVGRDTMFLSAERPAGNVQIVIAPRYFDDELIDGMTDWVIHGGQLIFFSDNPQADDRLFQARVRPDATQRGGPFIWHRVGLGMVFIGDANEITNISLLENGGSHGQLVANLLEAMDFSRIYFNEAYHGYNQNMTFFEMLPLPLRLAGMQIIIVIIIAVLYLGRRFGKPSPYYAEAEREENEYVFTLTNLYMSIGLGSAALGVYDRKLRKLAADYFKAPLDVDYHRIHELWKSENKPSLIKLEYVIENCHREFNTKKSKERNKFLKMIACYRTLIKELKK